VVETPRANLVPGMKWLLSTYTIRFNRRHKLLGHIFSGRYQALRVEGSGSGYLRTACDYAHSGRNCVNPKILMPGPTPKRQASSGPKPLVAEAQELKRSRFGGADGLIDVERESPPKDRDYR